MKLEDKIIFATVTIVGLALAIVSFATPVTLGGIVDNSPVLLNSATSSAIQVGPQQNVRVIATSTARSYLLLQKDDSNNTVIYCRADQDIAASVNQGIMLNATSTRYEFTYGSGNRYGGAVRCTAAASTTLLVTEFSATSTPINPNR